MIHYLHKQQHSTQWVSQPLLCLPDACCPPAPWPHPSCSPPATVTPTKDSATLGLCPATWLCHLYWGQLPLGPSFVAWCRQCSRRAPSWPQALLLEGPALAYNGINPQSCSWPCFHPCVNCHQAPGPWGHWAAGGMDSLHSSAKHCCCSCTELGQAGRIPFPLLLTPWQANCVEMLHVRNTARYDCCME